MFWSKNKKKKVYPCKPKFYYIKVGGKGVFVSRTCFHDGSFNSNENINKKLGKMGQAVKFRIINYRIVTFYNLQ